MKTALPLLLLSLAMAAWPAWGQSQARSAQVYRCGPEGRDLRDSPCPNAPGTATSAVTYDQPSDADSRAARARHLAEAKEAGALAQARRASEAEARHQRSQAVGLQASPTPPAAPASAPHHAHAKPPRLAKPHKPASAASAGR